MRCPNKNSREWQWCYNKALRTPGLASEEEIENKAKEIWVEEGYEENDDLHDYTSDKELDDDFNECDSGFCGI